MRNFIIAVGLALTLSACAGATLQPSGSFDTRGMYDKLDRASGGSAE